MNYGNIQFGENKPEPIDIMTVAIRCGDRLRYQERGKQTDLTARKTVDSVEMAEKINKIMCECYPNYTCRRTHRCRGRSRSKSRRCGCGGPLCRSS